MTGISDTVVSEARRTGHQDVRRAEDPEGAFARSLDHAATGSTSERQELLDADLPGSTWMPRPPEVTDAAPPPYAAYHVRHDEGERPPGYGRNIGQTETVLDPRVDATGLQGHLTDLHGRLAAARNEGADAVAHVAREAYRDPHASQTSIHLALHADMEARRQARNAQPGLPRMLRAIPDPHANSILQPTIDHAVASAQGHPNATLVADTIEGDQEIRRRLMRRESPRSGGSNLDGLQRDLDRLRQTQPVSPPAPASTVVAGNTEERPAPSGS